MKTGLFLAPGASRTAYAVGAIQALVESGVRFDVIGASSVGALNGSFVAMGKIEQLVTVWESWRTADVMRVDWGAIARGAVFWAPNLMNNRREHETGIDPFVHETDLTPGVRFRFNLANMTTGANEILEYPGHPMPLAHAVGASIAVPIVFQSPEWNGDHFADGLTMDGFPLEELVLGTGVERVFVIAAAPRNALSPAKGPMTAGQRAGDLNQYYEVTRGLEEADDTNEVIRAWQEERRNARIAIEETVDDSSLREDLHRRLDEAFDAAGFPYTRDTVEVVPILPADDLGVSVLKFDPATSRRLMQLGRDDARRVLTRLTPVT